MADPIAAPPPAPEGPAITDQDAPAVDLSGIDQAMNTMPGMTDLQANVSSATTSRASAQQDLDATIADTPQAPEVKEFTQQEPQAGQNLQPLMAMSPWLIILASFGGARTSLSANNMLAATTGMIDGLVKGNQDNYEQAHQRFEAERQKFADLQKQKWDVYREMVKVYKDRIDGKQRALQIAEAAVRDARKDRSDAMQAYYQTVRASVALRDQARKVRADAEKARKDREDDARKRAEEAGRNARHETPAGGKAAAKTASAGEAVSNIDQLIKMLDSEQGSTLGVTGLGGRVRRGMETVGNVTGMSEETSAHDFESKLSALQAMVAPILLSTRTAKDQREKLEKIVRGLHAGDTRQNTRSALVELKKQLQGLTAADTVRVLAPDGKSTGSIPRSQLADALKKGYKQLQ